MGEKTEHHQRLTQSIDERGRRTAMNSMKKDMVLADVKRGFEVIRDESIML